MSHDFVKLDFVDFGSMKFDDDGAQLKGEARGKRWKI